MNSLPLLLKFARYHYICYHPSVRIRMGRKKRDAYLTKLRPSPIDFLPERYYIMRCRARAIPRKGTLKS